MLRRKSIGYIFQFFNLIPTLNVFENVAFPLSLANTPRSEVKSRVAAVLAEVGLGNRATHFPNELSGGEMQRVAIARAIVHNPPLILADEPTGNLDSKNGEMILDLIRGIHENAAPDDRDGHAFGAGRGVWGLRDPHRRRSGVGDRPDLMILRALVLRPILREAMRTTLTILGIAVGVAVVVAIALSNQSALRAFRESVDAVAGAPTTRSFRTSALERGRPAGAAAVLAARRPLRARDRRRRHRRAVAGPDSHPGRRSSAMFIQGLPVRQLSSPSAEDTSSPSTFSPTFTSAITATPAWSRASTSRRRRTSASSATTPSSCRQLSRTSTNCVSARRSRPRLRRQTTMIVRGLLEARGPATAFNGAIAIADIAVAQAAFGLEGRLTRIDLIVPDDSLIPSISASSRRARAWSGRRGATNASRKCSAPFA